MKFLKEFIQETDYCSYCPMMCRFACPVVSTDGVEAHAPGRRLSLIRLLRTGELKPDEDVAGIFYRCAECMRCHVYCEHGISPPDVLRKAKDAMVRSGIVLGYVKKARENYKESGNYFGLDLQSKLAAVVPKEFFRPSSKVLYFTGCVQARFYPSTAAKVLRILRDLGTDVSVVPGPVMCSGYPYLALGDMETFRTITARNSKILNSYDMVLSPCPACVHTFTVGYRESGNPVNAEVVPLISYLFPFLRKGILSSGASPRKNVAYHDPCFLGRRLRIYEEPREALKTIIQGDIIESHWGKEDAMCCGAGGGLPLTNPGLARAIAIERVGEFKDQGAEVIVTACPSCQRWLERAGTLEVKDILELL